MQMHVQSHFKSFLNPNNYFLSTELYGNWLVTFNIHQIRNLIQIFQKFRIQFKITAERIFSLQEINKIYH
jgi:hypothetical protein